VSSLSNVASRRQADHPPEQRSAAPPPAREGAARVIAWRIAVLVAAVGVWAATSGLELLNPMILPAPWRVLEAFVAQIQTAQYWQALGLTLYSALLGFGIAAIIGIVVGVLTGLFVAVELSTQFIVDFGRAFPAIALLAVMVLMFGTGVKLKVILVIVAVVFPIIIQTHHGVRSLQPALYDTARAFRIPTGLLVRKVMLPNAVPSIITGLRISASVAVLIAISAEVLAGASGIGGRITDAQMNGNPPVSFAYIATAGFLGYGVNVGLERLQRVLLRWRPTNSEGGK